MNSTMCLLISVLGLIHVMILIGYKYNNIVEQAGSPKGQILPENHLPTSLLLAVCVIDN